MQYVVLKISRFFVTNNYIYMYFKKYSGMQFTVSMTVTVTVTVTVTHLAVADLSRAWRTWTQVTQVEGALFHAPG